ncbi:MAG: hypothetical protein PHR92_12065 [Lachnospiraceae bacterium]|nr:hypothetical protein [Lachnospiraceae bacterium]
MSENKKNIDKDIKKTVKLGITFGIALLLLLVYNMGVATIWQQKISKTK